MRKGKVLKERKQSQTITRGTTFVEPDAEEVPGLLKGSQLSTKKPATFFASAAGWDHVTSLPSRLSPRRAQLLSDHCA